MCAQRVTPLRVLYNSNLYEPSLDVDITRNLRASARIGDSKLLSRTVQCIARVIQRLYLQTKATCHTQHPKSNVTTTGEIHYRSIGKYFATAGVRYWQGVPNLVDPRRFRTSGSASGHATCTDYRLSSGIFSTQMSSERERELIIQNTNIKPATPTLYCTLIRSFLKTACSTICHTPPSLLARRKIQNMNNKHATPTSHCTLMRSLLNTTR